MKKCPKCEIDLKSKNIGVVAVDECEKCKGVWFDKDELRKAKDETDSDLGWLDFDIWKHEDQFKSDKSDVMCPACDVPTVSLKYGHTGVEVHCCTTCKGIWLDRGEFEKIVASLEDELVTKSFPDYVLASVKEASELVAGSKSFASEWKDFQSVLRLMQCRFFVERPGLLGAVTAIQDANPLK